MLGLSRRNDWNSWIAFFLRMVIKQANEDGGKARAIQELYDEMKYRVTEVIRSQFSVAAIDTLFSKPVFTPPEFARISTIPKASANRLLAELYKKEIILFRSEGRGRRPTVYEFPELLAIVKGGLVR